MTAPEVLRSVNKLIGALVGGGVIALLVSLHVIPAGVGNTVLTVLGVAGTALGTFLAPSNKPITVNPTAPAAETDVAPADPPAAEVDVETERLLAGPHVAEHARD